MRHELLLPALHRAHRSPSLPHTAPACHGLQGIHKGMPFPVCLAFCLNLLHLNLTALTSPSPVHWPPGVLPLPGHTATAHLTSPPLHLHHAPTPPTTLSSGFCLSPASCLTLHAPPAHAHTCPHGAHTPTCPGCLPLPAHHHYHYTPKHAAAHCLQHALSSLPALSNHGPALASTFLSSPVEFSSSCFPVSSISSPGFCMPIPLPTYNTCTHCQHYAWRPGYRAHLRYAAFYCAPAPMQQHSSRALAYLHMAGEHSQRRCHATGGNRAVAAPPFALAWHATLPRG